MRVPRFWAVAEGSAEGKRGQRFYRRVWGWSMSSAAEALHVAQERLRAALAELRPGARAGGGYYPRMPLREPILDEVTDGGEQILVVTRNRYGAEILNTDRLLIADVDLPGLSDRPLGPGFWRRLLGLDTPWTDPDEQPPVVVKSLGRIADWAAINPSLGVIVYRTSSGLRVFVTGVSEPATSADGRRILAELGTDPIYRELCRTHGTFRARLTPKPWRLPGTKAPGIRWPFVDERAERRFERWLAAYESAAAGYAVCRHLATHGRTPSALEDQILRLHDDRTRVLTSLPLA